MDISDIYDGVSTAPVTGAADEDGAEGSVVDGIPWSLQFILCIPPPAPPAVPTTGLLADSPLPSEGDTLGAV